MVVRIEIKNVKNLAQTAVSPFEDGRSWRQRVWKKVHGVGGELTAAVEP